MKRKYTSPRLLLKPEEVPLYDLMLATSDLLRLAAEGGLDELDELAMVPGVTLPARVQRLTGLHAMLTYVFTLGVSFAVSRQAEVAAAQLRNALGKPKKN